MANPSVRLTYEDYLHFPADRRWEVIDGQAYVVPSPNRRHQEIAGEIYHRLRSFLDEHPTPGEALIAPFDVVLFDTDVVQPDVVYVSDVGSGVLTDANIRGTPTWVVEVMSDPRRDRQLKRQAYERAAVPEYWIVDPDGPAIEVYRYSHGRYDDPDVHRAGDPAEPHCLPGFRLDPADLA